MHIDDLIAFSQQHNVPHNQSRHNLPYIILPTTVDEQLIRSQVSSNILASELVDIWIDNVSYLRLNNSNLPITAYTDGSLSSKHVRHDHSRPNNISMMGSGWFIVETNRRFDCGSQLWPSSTKAELVAIWSLLLTAPTNSKLHIITDSQAAIDGIRNHLTTPTVRIYFKSTNGPILDAIRHSTTVKNLTVNYIKIKVTLVMQEMI